MELLVIRHAEPVRIAARLGGAPADPKLTTRGFDQAQRLGKWLAAEKIDHIIASPLLRARQTAEPLAKNLGLKVEIDPGVMEWDAHSAEYIPIEEIREKKDHRWDALIAGDMAADGGPGHTQFRAEVVPTFDRIIGAHKGERVAVVCHGGVINVFLAHVLGIDRALWFEPHYSSVHRVAASQTGIKSIVTINELAHLVGTRS